MVRSRAGNSSPYSVQGQHLAPEEPSFKNIPLLCFHLKPRVFPWGQSRTVGFKQHLSECLTSASCHAADSPLMPIPWQGFQGASCFILSHLRNPTRQTRPRVRPRPSLCLLKRTLVSIQWPNNTLHHNVPESTRFVVFSKEGVVLDWHNLFLTSIMQLLASFR